MDLRALILPAMLAGCAAAPTQVVVPVAQRVAPPAELLSPILPPPSPVFVAPDTTGAVACLLPAGRDALVGHVDLLRQRVGAWAAWAGP